MCATNNYVGGVYIHKDITYIYIYIIYIYIYVISLCATNNYVGGSRDANQISFFLEIRETCVCLVYRLEVDWISLKSVYSILQKLMERFYHVAC